MSKLVNKLEKYIDASFPIIYLYSFEESKCERIIKQSIHDYRGYITWDSANGFFVFSDHIRQEEKNLYDTLNLINTDKTAIEGKVLVLKDIHHYFDDASIVRLLKEYAIAINNGLNCCIIIVSPMCIIPKELENYIILLELDIVNQQEIKKIIVDFLNSLDVSIPKEKVLNRFVNAFKGLSEFEIQNILALAIAEDGELGIKDLSLIFEQKRQIIKKSGILEMISFDETVNDIGGLDNLKLWLKDNATVFKDIDKAKSFGVDIPKGVLMVGMPGCGKSLSAKVASKLFNVPLIRMDMGRLMGKYVGESEANMRKAINLAEAISPCVLWIDEMEKAFAGINENGGGAEVTTRLFGTFLTWLQEKKSLAFVVATANDISKMPPEMLRKGRFDEIFYVDLPKENERRKIFEIHIKKRRKEDLSYIDLNKLVDKTAGYSGADIEGVVKESIKKVFVSNRKKLSTEDILFAIENTHSLSEVMKEAIDTMKKVYEKCKFKNASC